MKRLYLSGPMTGLPELNYPAFFAAATTLRTLGYEVLNPAENFDGDQALPYATYFRADLHLLLSADALVALPNWMRSRGACLEIALAQVLDLPVLDAFTLEPLAVARLADRLPAAAA